MKNVPKVAVITRTKDRGILLERAIQSVHAQTMRDFVHVIYNDAGDRQVVDNLVEKYKDIIDGRVKVVHNDTPNGLVAALNNGIKAANSEYVAIHDDDDTWDKDFLKKTTEYLDTTDAYGVITVVDIVEETIENGKVIELKRGRGLEPVKGMVSILDQCIANYASTNTFVYRRAVYDEIGYYDEGLKVAEDWDFTLRFLLKHDIHSLVTDEALAFYHHRATASGTELNSIFAENGLDFEYHIKGIANHHLRKELKSGKLGLGYLISLMRHNKEALIGQNDVLNGRINESVKHELHYVADGIKEYVNHKTDVVTRAVEDNSFKHSIAKRFKNSD